MNTYCYEFPWDGKLDNVKWQILQNNFRHGEMKLIYVKNYVKACKIVLISTFLLPTILIGIYYINNVGAKRMVK